MRSIQAFAAATLLVIGTILFASVAGAQQYPSRTVNFIVPFPAGGLSDVIARVVATELQKRIGGSIAVENRVGGSGTVGAGYVARSAPDGYTLLVTAIGDVTSLHYMKPSYNILTDFTHIALFADGPPLVLVVNPSLPYRSVAELVAGAKANPGKLSFGSSGPGTSPSIAISQLRSVAQIDIVDVPYRGVTQAAAAVMANEIHASFPFLASVRTLAEEGKIRALATTGQTRSPTLPNVPTMIESGFLGFEHEGFVGLAAPANTPPDIIDMLNKHIDAIVREEPFVKRFQPNGMRPPARNSPKDVAEYMSREVAKHRELAKLMPKQIQ